MIWKERFFKYDLNNYKGSSKSMSEKETKELIIITLYIIQDIAAIKSKLGNTGNFIKISLKNKLSHFEIAIGNSSIRINEYNAV